MTTLFNHILSLLNPSYNIYLKVRQDNIRAKKFYEKIGFEKDYDTSDLYTQLKYKWKEQ